MTSTFVKYGVHSDPSAIRHVPDSLKAQSSVTPETTKNCQLVDLVDSISIEQNFAMFSGGGEK